MVSKDRVLEVAGCVGKGLVRSAVYVGTNIAIIGGGMLGSMFMTGGVKNKVAKGAIFGLGCAGSVIAAYFAGSAIDDKLVEEYDLDINGV